MNEALLHSLMGGAPTNTGTFSPGSSLRLPDTITPISVGAGELNIPSVDQRMQDPRIAQAQQGMMGGQSPIEATGEAFDFKTGGIMEALKRLQGLNMGSQQAPAAPVEHLPVGSQFTPIGLPQMPQQPLTTLSLLANPYGGSYGQ